MSIFLAEGSQGGQQQSGGTTFTPADPASTSDDVALMQRTLQAAANNPNLIPDPFLSYILDYIQSQRLQISIGQVFGYQRIAPQVITSFAQVPNPVDGQIILLKIGSASPFIYVQMMYDQNAAQWVSEEFSAGGGAVQTTSDTYVDFGGFAGISWAPVHKAGLTMQLKWSGSLENEASTADAQIKLVFGNLTTSFTTATMSHQSSAGDAVTRPVGVDWTTVTDPGDYSVVAIGLQAKRNGAGTTACSAGIVGRFLK